MRWGPSFPVAARLAAALACGCGGDPQCPIVCGDEDLEFPEFEGGGEGEGGDLRGGADPGGGGGGGGGGRLDCVELSECLVSCPQDSDPCVDACLANSCARSAQLYLAYNDCMGWSCREECLYGSRATCLACADEYCAPEARACGYDLC